MAGAVSLHQCVFRVCRPKSSATVMGTGGRAGAGSQLSITNQCDNGSSAPFGDLGLAHYSLPLITCLSPIRTWKRCRAFLTNIIKKGTFISKIYGVIRTVKGESSQSLKTAVLRQSLS